MTAEDYQRLLRRVHGLAKVLLDGAWSMHQARHGNSPAAVVTRDSWGVMVFTQIPSAGEFYYKAFEQGFQLRVNACALQRDLDAKLDAYALQRALDAKLDYLTQDVVRSWAFANLKGWTMDGWTLRQGSKSFLVQVHWSLADVDSHAQANDFEFSERQRGITTPLKVAVQDPKELSQTAHDRALHARTVRARLRAEALALFGYTPKRFTADQVPKRPDVVHPWHADDVEEI